MSRTKRYTAFEPSLRAMIPSYIGVVLACLVVSVAGCGHSSPTHDTSAYPSEIAALAVDRQDRIPLVQSQIRGRETYERYCAICHGAEADGNGFNAAMLDPPPRNFADPDFWKQTDEDRLIRVIHNGGTAVGKSVLMPAWGRTLDERQIRDVVAFLGTMTSS